MNDSRIKCLLATVTELGAGEVAVLEVVHGEGCRRPDGAEHPCTCSPTTRLVRRPFVAVIDSDPTAIRH